MRDGFNCLFSLLMFAFQCSFNFEKHKIVRPYKYCYDKVVVSMNFAKCSSNVSMIIELSGNPPTMVP